MFAFAIVFFGNKQNFLTRGASRSMQKPHHGAKNVYKSAPRAKLQGITPALSCQTLPDVACTLVAIPRYLEVCASCSYGPNSANDG